MGDHESQSEHEQTAGQYTRQAEQGAGQDTGQVEQGAGQDTGQECAVCLQPSVFPVQLPCSHVFCFLCVKGFTTQSKRCAMCRREVPEDFLQQPDLLRPLTQLQAEAGRGFQEAGECWQWLYEGRNGWWLYDERTQAEVRRGCFGGKTNKQQA